MLFKNLILIGLAGLAAAQSGSGQSCGRKMAPCLKDSKCKPDSASCQNLDRCSGTCYFKNQYQSCGGFTATPPPPCKKGTRCIDDPRIPGSCGMACDMPGICAPKNAPSCHGFTGEKCPKGLYCYDDPSDDCDPDNGGADCPGICL
ncbi:hypothetical protein FDECE_16574 [Fusarium decemcellulare]|nr:hypothetical protein FDECE_16574 [Fusarium decemcellulare]